MIKIFLLYILTGLFFISNICAFADTSVNSSSTVSVVNPQKQAREMAALIRIERQDRKRQKEQKRREEFMRQQDQERQEEIKKKQIIREDAQRKQEWERQEHQRQAQLEIRREATRKQLEAGVEVIYREALRLYKRRDYSSAADKFKDVEDIIPGYKHTEDYMDEAHRRSLKVKAQS